MKSEQELLQDVLEARDKVKECEGFLSDAKKVKDQTEAKLIEQMDNAERKSFNNITFNCTVIRSEQLYVSVEKERKEEVYKWIDEDCGRGDMIKPTIHNKTLSSFIGQRLKEGENLPGGMFSYYFKPGITIRTNK